MSTNLTNQLIRCNQCGDYFEDLGGKGLCGLCLLNEVGYPTSVQVSTPDNCPQGDYFLVVLRRADLREIRLVGANGEDLYSSCNHFEDVTLSEYLTERGVPVREHTLAVFLYMVKCDPLFPAWDIIYIKSKGGDNGKAINLSLGFLDNLDFGW